MSMKKTMVMVAAAVLLLAGPVSAQGIITATIAAQQAMQKAADELAELKKVAWDSKKADEIRNEIVGNDGEGLTHKFVTALAELKAEKHKLETNKEANGPQIAKLEEAEKDAQAAYAKLKTLQSYMPDNVKMKAALRSGTLGRAAAEANKAMTKTANAIKEVNDAVNTAPTGDDQPGTIEISKLTVKSGKLRLFITEKDGTEKEVFEGSKVKVTKYPIVIRASVQDSEKVRLEGQWGSGNANWDPKPNAFEHVYAYEGQNGGGRSEWTAREEYKWSVSDHKELLRTLGHRNSDASTQKATGDSIEIVPAKPIAQAVGIDLEAKSLKWERKSKLAAGERTADVVSKDATASAHIVVSIFPAGS